MSTGQYLVNIPDTGYQKLIAFLDEKFPHCRECNGRYDPEEPVNYDGYCQDCCIRLAESHG